MKKEDIEKIIMPVVTIIMSFLMAIGSILYLFYNFIL